LRVVTAVDAPVLERALAIIAERLPATESEIRARLVRRGFGADLPDLREIERAARRVERRAGFVVLRRHGAAIAVRREDFEAAQRLVAVTKRLATEWGPISVEDLLSRVPCDRTLAVEVLSALPSLHWLDRARAWVWMSSERGKFVRVIGELLRARSPRPAAELAAIVFRRSTLGSVPPVDVLAAALEWVPEVRVDAGVVAWRAPTRPHR
jgi:hypothetical protein